MGNTNDLFDQYKNMNIDETKEKVFVLLGLTGVGKSSFINGITNTQKCEIGHNAKSCTKNIQMVNTLLNGINYYIIDTPGFDDSKLDEEKINSTLQELRNYQRIGSILICLKYNDSKLSKSVKKALIGIMDIFPAEDFWEHTLIIRTWSQLSEDKLENHKNKYNGMLLKGINEDKELKDYMEKKNIKPPSNLREFYVDSDIDIGIDERTKNEYHKILEEIRKIYPIYKELKIDTEEKVFETKEEDVSFLNIIKYKHYTFTDFNDTIKKITNKVGEERYNLNNYKPIFCEVKREQENESRGILCWNNQYKTHYLGVKIYEINHKQHRQEYEIEWRYEGKTRLDEKDGEDYKDELLRELKAEINANEGTYVSKFNSSYIYRNNNNVIEEK